MQKFIKDDRSIIVAADVPDSSTLIRLAQATTGIPKIGGFKFGITQGLEGLKSAIHTFHSIPGHAETVVIYDHQKAGNDIPDMGEKFAKKLKSAGVDVAILFPFTGPATQRAWTEACFSEGLQVMTGGIMTHPQFLRSEGGYISDDAPERIFQLACVLGVHHFVVPGNKPLWVQKLRDILIAELGEDNFSLSAPGFITQGGDISECGQIAGKIFYPIVGSGIYAKETPEAMRNAALSITKRL